MLLATALTTIALLPGLLTGPPRRGGLPADPAPDPDLRQLLQRLRPAVPVRLRRPPQLLDPCRRRPECNGANACFAADFRAEKGGKPFGRGKVTLTKGRKGRFQPLSCGGSCSPPSISWKERGVTYTIQAKVVGEKSDRQLLTKMANEAIRRGPR